MRDLGRFVRLSGAPRRLASLEVEDMDADGNEEVFRRVAAVGDLLAAGAVREISVVLTGTFGTGKTRVATWLLRRAFEFWGARALSDADFPRFFRAVDLAELRFGRSFSSPEDEEDRREERRLALERAPVVVIDDLTRVNGYKGEELFVETVVEKRYDAELATILTANSVPAEGRFADFIRYFEEMPILGRSRRG